MKIGNHVTDIWDRSTFINLRINHEVDVVSYTQLYLPILQLISSNIRNKIYNNLI